MGSVGDFLVGFVTAGAFLFCVAFIGYVLLIVVPFMRHKPAAPGDASDFDWHYIVPCLDEGLVIEDTVRRLIDDFPVAHVWVVDDASTDDSPEILDRLARELPRLHVIHRVAPDARVGKGPALNAAWRALRAWLPDGTDAARVVVGVVDADGRLDPECPDMISGRTFFGNPQVGAVQIKVRLFRGDEQGMVGSLDATQRGRLLVRMQDAEFTSVFAAIQTLRRHVGSVGMGGNGQFARLSVLERIAAEHGTPWHGALLEDFELGLHVLLSGSRTEYCHDTWVAQEGLPSLRMLIRQRSRWAQGAMQCMRYLWPILRSNRIATGGAFEISYFLFLPWFQLMGSVFHIVCTVSLVYYIANLPGGAAAWFAAGGWGFVPLFVVFGLLPLVVWGPIYRATQDRSLTRRQAWVLGLANWPYAGVHYAATWWAFTRVVRARHDWKKTARVLERAVPVSLRRALVVPGRFRIRPGADGAVVVPATFRFNATPTTGPRRDHEDHVAA
jgi:cellulose synthase/poly-beta-1,6-N-acetylglucosamine synthase-like glycosyltransferase